MKQSEILLKLLEQQATANSDIGNIQKDLKEHMRRTAALESRSDRFERFMYMTHGVVAFVTAGAAIVAFLKYFA